MARTHSRSYFFLPRPTLAPIFLFRAPAVHQYPPPSCTKTVKAVLSQTGVLQVIVVKVVKVVELVQVVKVAIEVVKVVKVVQEAKEVKVVKVVKVVSS